MESNFFTNEEFFKLPKWAQNKVNVLQMRLREAKGEIDRIKDNPESNTIVGSAFRLPDEPPVHYLRNDERITFVLNDGKVSIRVSGDMLDVHAMSDEKNLCVYPAVANGLYLALTKKP